MKILRKIIEIDEERCDGCGLCVPECAEGALEIINGKATVVADKYCDGLGACLGECPNGALSIIERESEAFDEAAVERFLSEKKSGNTEKSSTQPCGCPSTMIQSFTGSASCRELNMPTTMKNSASALSHWPVQILLVPPTAPFLKGADLLVVADCAPLAYPAFHEKFLRGKAVMMGCPKLDDAQLYIEKFANIFKVSGITRITTVVMEVPCCSGLPMIVKKGMAISGKNIPVNEVVISTKGEILMNR